MKKVISLEQVPFEIPGYLKNKELTIQVSEKPEINKSYYYISTPNIFMVYSYDISNRVSQKVTELSVHDVFEAIDANYKIKSKIKEYVRN